MRPLPAFTALLLLTLPAWAATITGWPDLSSPARASAAHPEDAAVIIANETYDGFPPVPYALRDGHAFEAWARLTRGIPGSRIHALYDGDAVAVEAALDRALSQVGPDGVLWVFFSGHGLVSPSDGTHQLLAADANPDGGFVLRNVLSIEGVQERLSLDDLGHGLLIVDAGFSGWARGGETLLGALTNSPDPPPPSRQQVVTWLAAGPGEWAGPLLEARLGMFTWHVLAALRGWADGALDRPDGDLTIEELQHWTRSRVSAARRQTPSVDPRATARAWRIGPAVEAPPILHQPEPALPSARPLSEEPLTTAQLKERKHASDDPAVLSAALRKAFLAKADDAWRRAYARAMRGDLDGLNTFVAEYASVAFYHQGRLYEMAAPQVPLARRMLAHGGRPAEPLVPAIAIAPQTVVLGSPVGAPGRGASEILSTVRLTRPFAVSPTEVTQQQYVTVVGHNPVDDPQPDRPVVGVSWYDAVLFCNALSALDGFEPAYDVRGRRVSVDLDASGWRLPSEAEWMAVAQVDVPGATSPCRRGNVRDRQAVPDDAARCDDGFAGLSPVTALSPNRLGIHGLHGNVAEWTSDAWATLPGSTVTDPEPGNSSLRVVKGASFLTDPEAARVPSRVAQRADDAREDLGFRVVRTLPPEAAEALERAQAR